MNLTKSINMKIVVNKPNYLWMALLFTFITTVSIAQSIEITPSYGYQFGTRLDYGRNYIEVEDSDQWGITVGYETFTNTMIELSYVRQSTQINIRDIIISPSESRLADFAGDWIMAGGTRYFPKGNIRPFVGTAFGVVIMSPSNENRDIVNRSLRSDTRFAFSFKGGINFMFSERVGFNIQGNLMFPVNWGGVYVGGGTGGVTAGASVSSTTVIGGFSGGLVFKLR